MSNTCEEKHMCSCGMGRHWPHQVGTAGCIRIMVDAPVPAPENPTLGPMWDTGKGVVTDFSLRQQRGYHQHPCGCWSRWPGSITSMEFD